MKIKQIMELEKRLFSADYRTYEKTAYPEWPILQESYLLEDLLEPYRVQ